MEDPVAVAASATCSFRGSKGGSEIATVANKDTWPPRSRKYSDMAFKSEMNFELELLESMIRTTKALKGSDPCARELRRIAEEGKPELFFPDSWIHVCKIMWHSGELLCT